MMRTFSLYDLVTPLAGTLHGESVSWQRLSIDSRRIESGDLYVAIRGERFDGHDFIADAVSKGAVAVVADRSVSAGVPVLEVADTREALGRIAALNRTAFEGSLVAVTGSCGKTTTKELLTAVLRQQGETLSTRGNLNNDIGAPLTLLELCPQTRYAVIELGASAGGEIAWTSSLAAPRVSMITNASEAHLAGFGSLDGIVEAKGEIIDGTAADGTVVLNADDPAFPRWQRRAAGRAVVGVSAEGRESADYRATEVQSGPDGSHFILHRGGEKLTVQLPLPGRHNVSNALLVIAAVESIGIESAVWQAGLQAVVPTPGRLQPVALKPGVTLLDDSYNANPASMMAALETLAGFDGRRVAVLGDMAELGSEAQALHRKVAEKAHALGIEDVLVCGAHAADYRLGHPGAEQVDGSQEEVAQRLLSLLDAPVTVLVKGSRSAGMDQVVASLKEKVQS